MVVELVHMAFMEGRLEEEATWEAVVLIPKGRKDYCDIGLVEVMWTVVAEILNFRLAASITFHDFLHGFWVGCDKLLQQLAALRGEVLYAIFLGLYKAYDALGVTAWAPEPVGSSRRIGGGWQWWQGRAATLGRHFRELVE